MRQRQQTPEQREREFQKITFGQFGTSGEDAIVLLSDFVENGESPAGNEFDFEAHATGKTTTQRETLPEKTTRPFHLELHQPQELRRFVPRTQLFAGDFVRPEVRQRKIDATDLQIAANILPEIGELQPGAIRIGET